MTTREEARASIAEASPARSPSQCQGAALHRPDSPHRTGTEQDRALRLWLGWGTGSGLRLGEPFPALDIEFDAGSLLITDNASRKDRSTVD